MPVYQSDQILDHTFHSYILLRTYNIQYSLRILPIHHHPQTTRIKSFSMSEIPHGQPHDRNALILYGSETGNSQDVAEELARIVERLHFITRVCEMGLVDIVCHACHVILSSTFITLYLCDCITHRENYLNILLLYSLYQPQDRENSPRIQGSFGVVF